MDKSAREINQTKTKDYYLYNDSYLLFSFLGFSLEYEEGSRCGHVPEVGKWYQRSKQQAMFIQSIHAVPPLLLPTSLFSLLLYQMPLRRPQPPVSYCLSLVWLYSLSLSGLLYVWLERCRHRLGLGGCENGNRRAQQLNGVGWLMASCSSQSHLSRHRWYFHCVYMLHGCVCSVRSFVACVSYGLSLAGLIFPLSLFGL